MKDEYDSKGFVRRWHRLFTQGDPFYNHNLTKNEDTYATEGEPAVIRVAGHPLFSKEEIRRIVVLKLDHIGDFITALPAIRRLKEIFPSAKLTVVAAKAAVQLAQLESAIDDVIVFEFFHARSGLGQKGVTTEELESLRERLQPDRYDLAIDLRKAVDTRHVLKYTSARFLAGYDHRNQFPWLDVALEWDGDMRLLPKRYHITDDLLHLVAAIEGAGRTDRTVVVNPLAGELTDLPLETSTIETLSARPYACIHVGAGTELRQWPIEHYAALSDLLIMDGLTVVLVGGPDEIPMAKQVCELVRSKERTVSLAGIIPLSKLPIVMMRSALYIGNNSGPHHIAASLGVPVVGIHSGVVDAAEWGPLGPRAMAVQRSMNCFPCYIASAEDCHRGMACIKGLSPGAVYEWCRKMLALRVAPEQPRSESIERL
jgi:ADP-heptose:LPS heptosyltransferase